VWAVARREISLTGSGVDGSRRLLRCAAEAVAAVAGLSASGVAFAPFSNA